MEATQQKPTARSIESSVLIAAKAHCSSQQTTDQSSTVRPPFGQTPYLHEYTRLHPSVPTPTQVQWMDDKSWELLLRLKREVPQLLIIASMRDDLPPQSPGQVHNG
eukprot:6175399-Pleurochrysis_carterae.AAC.3